ncbi:hypothetical protein BKA56DRAFT_584162 [Ilyonectria sp. MPI-CAGE-AT-0026]|nr:hypothetical protein BKA56DRAFT_584162 [Ilyonectria sp. MPI-CAGE-AT-0026]
MSTNAKGRRLPSSCVNCRRRKIRCDKPTSRACGRCERLGLDCAVTCEVVARPYYHTSKERFELMATIVQHFSPATSLDVEDLRQCVSTLKSAPSGSWCPSPTQEGSPPSSVAQSTTIEALQAISAANDPSPSVSDDSLDGVFISDATCQRRFDGASSYTVLQHKVSSCIAERFPRLALLQREHTLDLRDGEPLWSVPAIALPDKRTCEQCGVTFFSHINSVVFILSPEKFFNAVDMAYSGRDTTSSVQAIIHLIVALINGSSENFELARMQMEGVIEEGSLESVQALMLMALYRQKHNQRHTSWVVLGSAVRIAQSLGMHIKTDDESLMLKEQKTRLWWSLYELDQWSSCILGQSSDLSMDAKGVPSPSDSLTAGNTSPPMYASTSARLAQFLSTAMSCIFLNQQRREQDTDGLIQDLEAWWASVPEHLTKVIMSDSFARATLYLRLRYHYILVLVTQHFLLNSNIENHTTSYYVKVCEDNNDVVITTLLDMQARNLLTDSLWFDSHHILSTSLILLLRIMKRPLSTDLQDKVKSMQSLLQSSSGKIQVYANECFNQVLKDISTSKNNSSHISELTFNSVLCDFNLWE